MILHGDLFDVLPTLAADSFDSCVTDPPYGLEFMGKDWDKLDAVARATRGTQPDRKRPEGEAGTSQKFQLPAPAFDLSATSNRAMQDWHARWAREVYRVLKPGAYLVAFGGTRTHHRLMSAIEDAGFEIRDCLMWLYGSGFPKSLDVSKAIDEAAGIERPVVGYDASRARPNRLYETNAIGNIGATGEGPICDRTDNGATRTGPASDTSRQWMGWGTALKPAYEPIILARKPLIGTVATNILQHGTGALNIDASRIGVETRTYSGSGPQPSKLVNHGPGDTGLGLMDGRGQDLSFTATGRWPANVLLSHHPDCLQTGTREVPRELRDARARTTPSQFGAMGGSEAIGTTHESIDTFACVPDCPVALLDAQSGDIGSESEVVAVQRERNKGWKQRSPGPGVVAIDTYGDTGGASRFFYTAKASRSERDLGTEHLDPQPQDPSRKDGNPGGDNPRNRGLSLRGNHHPTVKPVDLMRWLVTLVTPPQGKVLDCFFGSGSTGVACERLGHPYLGVEKDPAYVAIARRRCEAITPLFRDLDASDAPEE